VHERLAALQCRVTDPTPVEDRQSLCERVRIDVARGAGQRLVPGKATEGAGGVADVGDGKVADGWESKIWHF